MESFQPPHGPDAGQGPGYEPQPTAGPTLSIALHNNTSSSSVYAYITGLDINRSNAVFILRSDGWTGYYPSSPSATLQPLQADCAISLGSPGNTRTVRVPQLAGARIWICQGSQLTFLLNPGAHGAALVEPSATNPSDPNYNLLWSFAEFTFNSMQLFANISSVDFVCLPLSLSLRNTAGTTNTVVGLPSNGLDSICAQLERQDAKDGAGWSRLVVRTKDGSANLRALSPNSAITMQPELFKGYYQPYVDAVWKKYSATALSVDTQESYGTLKGKVQSGLLNFPDVGAFAQPSAADIFSCSTGPFAGYAQNTAEMGNITARLSAAFNRSTLLTDANQPSSETVSSYYADPVTNHYSRICHAVVIGSRGYAFPYDDVGPDGGPDQSGSVSDANPALLTVSVGGIDATVSETRVPEPVGPTTAEEEAQKPLLSRAKHALLKPLRVVGLKSSPVAPSPPPLERQVVNAAQSQAEAGHEPGMMTRRKTGLGRLLKAVRSKAGKR